MFSAQHDMYDSSKARNSPFLKAHVLVWHHLPLSDIMKCARSVSSCGSFVSTTAGITFFRWSMWRLHNSGWIVFQKSAIPFTSSSFVEGFHMPPQVLFHLVPQIFNRIEIGAFGWSWSVVDVVRLHPRFGWTRHVLGVVVLHETMTFGVPMPD